MTKRSINFGKIAMAQGGAVFFRVCMVPMIMTYCKKDSLLGQTILHPAPSQFFKLVNHFRMMIFFSILVYFSLKISTGKWPVMYARLGMNKGSRIVNFNFKRVSRVLAN